MVVNEEGPKYCGYWRCGHVLAGVVYPFPFATVVLSVSLCTRSPTLTMRMRQGT